MIEPVVTGSAGFAGREGPYEPLLVTSAAGIDASTELGRMVRGFFDNGGERAYVAGTLAALEAVEDIELLCPAPEQTEEAIAHCERRRDRLAIVSLPAGLHGFEETLAARPSEPSSFAAVHHPWVRAGGELTPPGGHVAGMYASGNDEMRGLGEPPLERSLPEQEVKALVEARINPLRDFRASGKGVRVWGARTLDPAPEWRYVPVRRLLMFLETSIERGLRWVVFEPNSAPTWQNVRNEVASFLTTQWRDGKLQGRTPAEAFFVRCDRTTMTQDDIDNGRLVCVIGVAALRPAEFVIFRIGEWTADRPCP